MIFDCKENNSKLIYRLERAVLEGKISHAYLFEGPSNMDKVAFANSFIKGVLCPDGRGENCGKCSICNMIDHGNHGDITYIEKEKYSIKDKSVELIQEKINVRPLGDRNVIVINDCDYLTTKAQNRLLKTLEEPPGDSLLILLTDNMENLVPTILSRCVKFRLEAGENDIADGRAQQIVQMALDGEPFHLLCKETESYYKDREKVIILLDSMEQVYRKHIIVKQRGVSLYKSEKICDSIESIEEARKRIKLGISSKNALKNLLLEISK